MSLNARSGASTMICFSPPCSLRADLQSSICFHADFIFESTATTHVWTSAHSTLLHQLLKCSLVILALPAR